MKTSSGSNAAHPWHAIFNRIYELNEYVNSGLRSWVHYMDADAYFVDFEFDLRGYVADKSQYALIASDACIPKFPPRQAFIHTYRVRDLFNSPRSNNHLNIV